MSKWFEKGGWIDTQAILPRVNRTMMLAPAVGVVAGLGAIAFHWMCHIVVHVALEGVAGYRQGNPAGEHELLEPAATAFNPWWLLLIPAIGGLISGVLVYRFAPEAEGHGTDSAIDAYHNKRGVIRARVPLIKMLSSAITIGTGGSGGREGPIAQIGAGFGSYLATRLGLADQERRVLMLAGLGAGIGAIFHAPLAGAIFAIEVLYRDPDFEAEALLPAFISTTVAYCVFCLVFGFETLFLVDKMPFDNPMLLLPLTALAAAMALAAWAYVRVFYGVETLFKKLPVDRMWRPAIGALMAGVLAVVFYFALGTLGEEAQRDSLSVLSFGYGFLQKVLHPDGATLLVPVLLVVGFGKMITTSLTISSGGSGGVFGPSMVIGGSLGAVIGLLFNQLTPELVPLDRVPIFTILGMASFFAAAANTPVSTLIMVSEMTGSYTLLLPAMWVCALAYMLCRRTQLYRQQPLNRLLSPAHRGDFIVDVLDGLTVRDAIANMRREFFSAPLDLPLRDMARLITDTSQSTFPVVDGEGHYRGIFGISDFRQILYDTQLADLAVAQDLANSAIEPLSLQTDLSSAMTQFAKGEYEELPVIDEDNPDKIIGLIRRQHVIQTYSSRLMALKTDDALP